jgi:hypothetical protein
VSLIVSTGTTTMRGEGGMATGTTTSEDLFMRLLHRTSDWRHKVR